MKSSRLILYLFLIPVLGKAYLWIVKPEWTYVSRLWALVDLPLYFFASIWLHLLCFRKHARHYMISAILLIILLVWEVVLNIVLPSEKWVLYSIFSLLGIGPIIGFLCLIPGYVLLAKHGRENKCLIT